MNTMSAMSAAARRVRVSFAVMRQQLPSSFKRCCHPSLFGRDGCCGPFRIKRDGCWAAASRRWRSARQRQGRAGGLWRSRKRECHPSTKPQSSCVPPDPIPESYGQLRSGRRNPFVTQLVLCTAKTGGADILTQTTVRHPARCTVYTPYFSTRD